MNRESLITGDNMQKKLTEFTGEEEIILNRVFDKYEERNESVVYHIGLSLMLTINFLMTAYLVLIVINN